MRRKRFSWCDSAFSLVTALVTTKAFEVPLADALAAIDNYEAPPGRGRLLAGKNNAIIIDDSYNASPAAVEEALATLKSFPNAKRRIAVLGDMLELDDSRSQNTNALQYLLANLPI